MNLVRHNEVLRNPTVKTEIDQKGYGEQVPFGFVAYPVSQAADIHILRANVVPVGDDQKPMLELADKIGRRFNKTYNVEVFNQVEGKYSETGRLIGTDGNAKMSKSLDNAIYLNDSVEQVQERVKKMYTDPNRVKATDPGTVEGNPVFIYHDAFNTNSSEVEDLKERYRAGTVGDVEVKEKLAIAINKFLEPVRVRRAEYPLDKVKEILMAGTAKAKLEAEETLEKVRLAMKINY
jgi:tryptophanyl-tRNA synthetase